MNTTTEELTIVLKRMQGSAKELSRFKKGKRFGSVHDAERELWFMSLTAPTEGEGHRIAYEIQREGKPTLYGSFPLLKGAPTVAVAGLRTALMEQYGVAL